MSSTARSIICYIFNDVKLPEEKKKLNQSNGEQILKDI